jgi:hypothetical protein
MNAQTIIENDNRISQDITTGAFRPASGLLTISRLMAYRCFAVCKWWHRLSMV